MPFRKNYEREAALLAHWSKGNTVKKASVLTGVPEGTVSYYYAKFNRNKHKYTTSTSKNGSQDPPRSSPLDVAFTSSFLQNLQKNVQFFLDKRDYARGRDYLQFISLYLDLEKRLTPIIQNSDPKKDMETLKYITIINKLCSDPPPDASEVERLKDILLQSPKMNEKNGKKKGSQPSRTVEEIVDQISIKHKKGSQLP